MIVGQIERLTQNRIIKLFSEKLGYTYLGNLSDNDNKNIDEKLLGLYLDTCGYSEDLIKKAINKFKAETDNMSQGLYEANKTVYNLLRYGVKVNRGIGEHIETINFIDWENPLENNFYVAEEVTVKGENNKRPDIVLYVNGIALGVIELKRSTVCISEGIRQNLDNQKEMFIKPFYSTIQYLVAGNDTEGSKYGTIETKEKYYLTWKEDEKATDQTSLLIKSLISDEDFLMDKQLIAIFYKERFIELMHDYVVFDSGIKKLTRHNQYFGIKAAQSFIKRREGGILWHTQGSGKSLLMVWLAKWIRENIDNSRVLLITDREELDEQIEKVFNGVSEKPYRTKSCQDLINKLNLFEENLICSLIHKFGSRNESVSEEEYDNFISELSNLRPTDFSGKGDIYVFVDECHRTQTGKLHDEMKKLLPNSIFIGFTGTPLLSKDKGKIDSREKFGNYIHTYKFDEAVKDKVVLDLCYEARDVEQYITNQSKIDEWFDIKTAGLTDYAKMKLKQKWGTMQSVLSSKSRLEQIVKDVIFDMETKDRLQNGKGNALLVAGSIYEACKYYELFQNNGLKKCAIITSYSPVASNVKGEGTGEDRDTQNIEKYDIYQKMLNGETIEDFEKKVKKLFIEEPAQMKLLIVVNKLLTGFDAPPATYLYIDKDMQDHGLFQAICRVNRLDGEDKTVGYIIDYKDLFGSIETSFEDYTADAFSGYDKEDIQGLLKNRLDVAKSKLDEAFDNLKSLCEPVEPPKGTINYLHYFCRKNTLDSNELKTNEIKRINLYKLTATLIRAHAALANEMIQAGYSEEESHSIRENVKYYDNIRNEIMRGSGEYIDLKTYESDMRYLIDNYIDSKDSKKISGFEDMPLVDVIIKHGINNAIDSLPESIRLEREATSETIENNVRKLIVDEMATNPKYFENMSKLLDELITERKNQVLEYQKYLERISEIVKLTIDPSKSKQYPTEINSPIKRALYDNLGEDEILAMDLGRELENIPDDFNTNIIKRRAVRNLITGYIIKEGYDEEKTEEVLDIIRNQKDIKYGKNYN